jgi:hypothetical protein
VGHDPSITIIIKDIEPGYFRASLSFLADKYISGDHAVSLVSRTQLTAVFADAFGYVQPAETTLFERDSPNYALVFDRAAEAGRSAQQTESAAVEGPRDR